MTFKKRKAFTLIELLIVMAVISILATVVLASIASSRARARANSASSSLRGALPIIITCFDANDPVAAPVVGNQICASATGSTWPQLPDGYAYNPASPPPPPVVYNGPNCNFYVSTDGTFGSSYIRCQCLTQSCDLL